MPKRTFLFETYSGQLLTVKPPKYKLYQKLISEKQNDKEMIAVMAEILSDNIEGIEITSDYIYENYYIDDINKFADYISWIKAEKGSDPN